MNDRCDPVRLSLGAYALGTLEPADQHLVETHLASCPACLGELAELEAVVPALASLSAEDIATPEPSADLFARVADAVAASDADDMAGAAESASSPARGRRARSTRWLVAVAAGVVVLAGAGTAIGIAASRSSSPSSTTVASAAAGAVRLRVAATDSPTGTRLELTAQGLPRHEHCHLVALASDGTRHDAGSWDASYEGHASVTETTDVPRSQLRRLTLYGDDGRRLVAVDV